MRHGSLRTYVIGISINPPGLTLGIFGGPGLDDTPAGLACSDAEALLAVRTGGVDEAVMAGRYGLPNGDLYECHHRVPLADLAIVRSTKASDLAILCPTCHRAIHRIDPLPTAEVLAAAVANP